MLHEIKKYFNNKINKILCEEHRNHKIDDKIEMEVFL
jgi:hypothetical protein